MPQPFTVEDLYLHRKVTACTAWPAGDRGGLHRVARSIARATPTRTHLWQFALDGSGGRQLTCSDGSDTSPRWSPRRRRLAFLSDARRLVAGARGAARTAATPAGRQLRRRRR